jgi:hypothetical protein
MRSDETTRDEERDFDPEGSIRIEAFADKNHPLVRIIIDK